MPILLLTALNRSEEKVAGLDAGADDFVVKPVDMAEISARIRALSRRGVVDLQPKLQWGELELDPSGCEVMFQGVHVDLSPKEYGLLELFLRNPRRVYSHSSILDHLWVSEDSPGTDTVRAHIKKLRQKLKKANAPDPVETVYGLGYRLKETVASPTESHSVKPVAASTQDPVPFPASSIPAPPEHDAKAPAESNDQNQQGKTQSILLKVWERHRSKQFERLKVLELAATQAQSGVLAEAQIAAAKGEAHKLAGALGSFGFPAGTDIARQIEDLLMTAPPLSPEQAGQFATWTQQLRTVLEGTPASSSATQPSHHPLSLLILEQDSSWSESFTDLAQQQGIRVERTSKLSTLKTILARQVSDGVIIDLQVASSLEEAKALMQYLTQLDGAPAIILLAGTDNLTQRIALAQAGRHRFLAKPISPAQALTEVQAYVQTSPTQGFKVLIVDDDPAILSLFQSILPPWGIKPTAVEEPQLFWQKLNHSRPDLVILDLNLSGMTGIDLCQVVRNDPEWSWIPILFMTGQADPETIHQMFTAGADDYIRKPIIEPELLSRILNRIERIQLLRKASVLMESGS